MRLITFASLVVIVLFACSACGWSDHILKPVGDTAIIKTNDGTTLTGEILILQDSVLYFLGSTVSSTKQYYTNTKIDTFPFNDIKSIEIDGYSDRSWEEPVIFFQAIPTVLFFIAASSAGVDSPGSAFLIFGIPTGLTYLLFEASTPSSPEITSPLTIEKTTELRKYTRFPKGLSPSQLETFLAQYK